MAEKNTPVLTTRLESFQMCVNISGTLTLMLLTFGLHLYPQNGSGIAACFLPPD